MKTFWISLTNFLLGGVLVGGVVWWLMASELGHCELQTVEDQHMIETLTDEHRAMADKLIVTKQQLDSAYTDLAHELGKKVDLTIPFKPIKAEPVAFKDNAKGIEEMTDKFLQAGMTWPAFKAQVKAHAPEVLLKAISRGK